MAKLVIESEREKKQTVRFSSLPLRSLFRFDGGTDTCMKVERSGSEILVCNLTDGLVYLPPPKKLVIQLIGTLTVEDECRP